MKATLDERVSPTIYRMAGQPMNLYGGNRGPVGHLGYFLPGNPDIWKYAALEYGEEELIYDAPRLVGGGTILNLGDDEGGSAILLAQGLIDRRLDGHVFTVDNYEDKQKRRAERNMESVVVKDKITILNCRTDEVLSSFDFKEKFSFIFIDADHSYEGVKHDWLTFSPLVSDHGLVGFHDSNQEYTNRVIEECITDEWTNVLWINRIKIYARTKWVI